MAVRIKVRRETGGAGDTPTTSDLEAYEIAQNTADKRLFGRDGSNNIFEFGINPTSLTTGAITASGTVTANSSLVSSNATFTGGTINGMVIGGSSAAAITATTVNGTVITASTNFSGNLTGNVTGNITGNVTGNITGSGSSTLTTLATTNFTAGGLTYPTSDGSANTVLATNGSGALSFISISGAYDLASQSEAEAGTETAGRIFSPLRVKQAIDALALSNLVSDTTPQLGGDLDGQGKDITDIGVLTKDTAAPIYGSSSSPIVLTVTVASKTAAHAYNGDGSSNGYFINGVEAPAIEFGGSDAATANTEYVYKFDQSDASNSGHPLVFYLDAAKATAYTTGVTTSGTPGSSGAYTQIAVDSETPKILYYQCSSHAYMGNYAVVPASLSFSAGTLRIAGTAVTSTGAELNVLDGIPGTLTATELGYVDGVTSSIQTQLDNISVTNGTLTKTFTAGETATVTLTSNVLVPSVAVTKEVAQSGVTNNDWNVNSSSQNYTRYNSAAATTLSFPAYDISSASPVDAFSISSQEGTPQGMDFNADGTKMFVIGTGIDQVVVYTLSTGFDVSTASHSTYYNSSGQTNTPRDVTFSPNGTKMFIVDGNSVRILEYTLTTGFDVSTASYTRAYTTSSQDSEPKGVAFNTDGTKMFVSGNNGNKVYEYAVSTGFNLSSVSYTRNYEMGSNNNAPGGIVFDSSGKKMFVARANGPSVTEFALASAFDLSSVSYVQAYDTTSTEGEPRGLAFNTDGTKMFVVGENGDEVNEYTLPRSKVELGSGSFASGDVGKVIEANSGVFTLTSTAGAFTQLTAPTSFNEVASGSWQLYALKFNTTDGDLEISSVSDIYNFSAYSQQGQETYYSGTGSLSGATSPMGIVVRQSNGQRMWTVDNDADKLIQWSLSGFSDTTPTYDYAVSISSQTGQAQDLAIPSPGNYIYVCDNDSVYRYNLGSAYNVNFQTSHSQTYSTGTNSVKGIDFNDDGTKFYLVRSNTNQIRVYTLSTAYDLSTASNTANYTLSDGPSSDASAIRFKDSGKKLFILKQNDVIYEWSLTTGYDFSTISFVGSVNMSLGDSDTRGFDIGDTGKYFYSVGSNARHYIGTIGAGVIIPSGYHAAHTTTSTDSTYWTDINSMTASESAGDGNVYYCVSTDDRTTWKVAKGTDGERSIVRNNSGTWQYNSNSTYGSTTWANATVNNELYAIQEAMGTSANQMNKTQLDAVPDANHFTLANDLDLAIILNLSSGSTTPSSDGVAINYDAAVLNQGAVLGTDYNFDAPAQNKVRITSVNAANLKVRIV